MRPLIVMVFLIFFVVLPAYSEGDSHYSKIGVIPKNGFVPDPKTAEKLAEALLIPVYGEKNIKRQKPFDISLKEGIWYVRGSLPKGHFGGTAEILISKRNAQVLYMYHDR